MYYENNPIELSLDTGLDLAAATNQYIMYQLEDGTTASIEGTKDDQSVVATIPKDTTQAGMLYYQPFVSWDSGANYYHGDIGSVKIEKPLRAAV